MGSAGESNGEVGDESEGDGEDDEERDGDYRVGKYVRGPTIRVVSGFPHEDVTLVEEHR